MIVGGDLFMICVDVISDMIRCGWSGVIVVSGDW